jgi:hypothetical protein
LASLPLSIATVTPLALLPQFKQRLGPNSAEVIFVFLKLNLNKGDDHVTSKTNIQSAQANNPKYWGGRHPWHIPYNSRCLISGCETPVYHDGATFYSLCLFHLQELSLGPFHTQPTNKLDEQYDHNFLP